jgi:hypothetical protein
MQMATTNLNPSPPETVAAGTSTNISFSTVATSSAAIGDNNFLSTSSKKRAFVPADPALGGRGAEMGAKKRRKKTTKYVRKK